MSIRSLIKPLVIKAIPDNLIIWKGKGIDRSIALTFDDGPDPHFTEKILNILRDNRVKATFFLVGKNIKKYPHIALRIKNEGHEIGNHSFSHNNNSKSKLKNVKVEIEKTQQILKETLGNEANLFRPPYGIFSFDLIKYCIQKRLTIAMWSVDTRDFEVKSVDELREKISNANIKNGDIILMHDNNDRTLQVLPDLINQLKEQNFKFVTINKLLNNKFEIRNPKF